MNEDEYIKTKPDFDIPPLHIRIFYTVILRFIVLFVVTLVFSVANRAIVWGGSGELGRGGTVLLDFIVITVYSVFYIGLQTKADLWQYRLQTISSLFLLFT